MKKMKHEGGKKSRKQREAAKNPKIDQHLFSYLPPEIISNILSRLPARSVMSCKRVCKPWLDMLTTPFFVKSHISNSVPSLALFLDGGYSKPYKVFEFVDELNLSRRVCRWKAAFNFNLPCNEPLYGSADGLLFLCTRSMKIHDGFGLEYVVWPRELFICNPITREYIRLPRLPESSSSKPLMQVDTFGFGVSGMTGQYKLVRICHEWIPAGLARTKCQVYTVGTGSWRRISPLGLLKYENARGVFLNGNLHWLVRDLEVSSVWISCFELETETFTTFSPLPPCHYDVEGCSRVSALKGCLCLCDNSADDEIVIWSMKEYGDEKSWIKEFVVNKGKFDYGGFVCPIKVFKNGDILMGLENHDRMLYFSNKTKTIRDVDVFGLKSPFCIRAITYTPSFLPLRTFPMENVSSFEM